MMRASVFRLTPLLLLPAVALLALAVFLVHDAQPASAHHGVVWYATLTEPEDAGTGCVDAEGGVANCSDFLTDNDLYITLEPYEHQIVAFNVFQDGTLRMLFDKPITSLSARPLTLTVDGRKFHSEDGELAGGGTALQWRNTGLGWDDGDRIKLSLEQRQHRSCDGGPDSSLNPTDLRAFGGNGALTLAWMNPDTDRGFKYAVRWRKDGTAPWLNPHGVVGEVGAAESQVHP